MKCIDNPRTFASINFINKKISLAYHIDKSLDKPITIVKEKINLNKKIKKAKSFNRDIVGIKRFII